MDSRLEPGALPVEAAQPVASNGNLQPKSPHYESLTHWRGVACLFVVAFHVMNTGYGMRFPDGTGPLAGVLALVSRLWIGVPLFFVISGYCVTASADATRRRQNPGLRFFWRRFHRIYPPFWAWLGVTALSVWLVEQLCPGFFANAFVPNPSGFTKWQWLGNLTLTENWRWHLTRGVESQLLAPAWTLGYEEQFYALVGLTLIFARRFIFGVFGLITLLVIPALFLLPALGFSTAGTFLDGKWLMFAAGILVYYALNYAPARLVWFALPLALGMLCAFAEPRHLLERRVNEPNLSYFSAFAFAILLLVLHRWDRPLAQAKILRPLFFCGEMCYSLYLTHWPSVTVASWAFSQLGLRNPFLVFFLGLPFCMGVAILLARVFHKLVERRFWNPAYTLPLSSTE
jgi:peptidoglycan/LPS O-acetylase OafA/YrhL